ncbi:hypothetical protein FRC00_006174 [Tulasnella sp. 408]|nr:hypothetical protein FRC00_006174 [Tulasnella sp. 408]
MQHHNQQTRSLDNATHSHLRLRDSHDAHILFQAVRQGHLPFIRKRLTRPEQQALHAGQVFVWADREGSFERWTDGHDWGSARVRGPFLVYDEVLEDTDAFWRRKAQQMAGERSVKQPREKTLSPLPGGLSKQTYSATFIQNGVDIQEWHLTAYFKSDSKTDNLITPDEDALLRTIIVPEGTFKSSMYRKSKGSSSSAHRGVVSEHQSNGTAGGDGPEIRTPESLIGEHVPLGMFSGLPLQPGLGPLDYSVPLSWETSFSVPDQRLRTSPSRGSSQHYQGRALLSHPPQPPCHDSGQHDNDDDDDVFEQLTRAISKYEPLRNYPSPQPTASSTSNEIPVDRSAPIIRIADPGFEWYRNIMYIDAQLEFRHCDQFLPFLRRLHSLAI